ncbi:zinc ribbon domain-containing protein [Streptomyces justiciae]|uniref:Zinc ribbon domain-containing protein n=1 Tax=Streptomyces justiciae TaxID=2780140 RepID=A0ABU3M6E2_9ACTN|nr:zinc ribbon domain-containing protein [Streptomyces justiciae]MDT7846943.1 zinc ribbon domain-containing protein [Streptomyces justiciae]
MYPSRAQAEQMLTHCAHARYVWNLAVEQHAHWRRWRKSAPGFAEQCRQLTEARRENEWLGAGNADVQQQALKDFARVKNARFTSGFGEPPWRRKHVHEGFRVIGTDRVPEYEADGSPRLNAKTGKQVMGRSVVVQKLNRRWARSGSPAAAGSASASAQRARVRSCPRRIREAEHQEHDPLGEGNHRAARKERRAEGRSQPGCPRPGLGPAAAACRAQSPQPGRGRSRPLHQSAVQCLLGAPPTPLRQWGRIDKNSRKSQAEFVCSSCGFTCNADTNASINVAAGQGGIPRPRRSAGAGGTTPPTKRSSVREPQPTRAGIPLFFKRGRM